METIADSGGRLKDVHATSQTPSGSRSCPSTSSVMMRGRRCSAGAGRHVWDRAMEVWESDDRKDAAERMASRARHRRVVHRMGPARSARAACPVLAPIRSAVGLAEIALETPGWRLPRSCSRPSTASPRRKPHTTRVCWPSPPYLRAHRSRWPRHPTDDLGAKACRNVVDGNAERGMTGALLRQPGPGMVSARAIGTPGR